MSSRSLNKVLLIGNLTRDPELRYTPQGTPVCTFGLATNRSWQPSAGGERQEETEFHRIVAWNKLAESCRNRLKRGSAVLIDGELQSRTFKTDETKSRTIVEIKAKRIQFLNKNSKNDSDKLSVEDVAVSEDNSMEDSSYEDNSFDKFLTDEESDLLNGKASK